MIHVLRGKATVVQMTEMLEVLNAYIKLAVDTKQGIAAGGGALHADCEAVLLEAGSRQEDIWGADLDPFLPRDSVRSIDQHPALSEQPLNDDPGRCASDAGQEDRKSVAR